MGEEIGGVVFTPEQEAMTVGDLKKTSEELKPCPWCGGEVSHSGINHFVCERCCLDVVFWEKGTDRSRFRDRWNTRAEPKEGE